MWDMYKVLTHDYVHLDPQEYNQIDGLSHSGDGIPGAGVGVQEDGDHQQGRHHPGCNIYMNELYVRF